MVVNLLSVKLQKENQRKEKEEKQKVWEALKIKKYKSLLL